MIEKLTKKKIDTKRRKFKAHGVVNQRLSIYQNNNIIIMENQQGTPLEKYELEFRNYLADYEVSKYCSFWIGSKSFEKFCRLLDGFVRPLFTERT